MDRSAAVFVRWEEVFSMNDKGRREVRYYLKRRDGTSDLAVVGKEKDLGHANTMSSCRYRYSIREKSLLFALPNSSIEFPSKLRSRREVTDWLSSIVTDGSSSRLHEPLDGSLEAGDISGLNLESLEDVQSHKVGQHTTEFLWVGCAWTCRKKRKHYESCCRNGVRISVHNFVYVLAEEDKRLVAYLDDMYEDSRGNKMVVVRWFHRVDEVGIDLPHSYNDREIFFSLCLQDLSIECIDGLATVLSPQHYEVFLKVATKTKWEPFVCQKQFDDEDLKPFDITQIKGYWNQEIHRYMSSTTLKGCPKVHIVNKATKVESSHTDTVDTRAGNRETQSYMSLTTSNGCPKLQPSSDATTIGTGLTDAIGIRPKKRLRRLKDRDMYAMTLTERYAKDKSDLPVSHDSKYGFPAEGFVSECAFARKHQYTIGSEVEVLSQDSGIRGCWFRAVIIKKHKDSLKVRYQDVKDAANESINLEEWILSSRIAAPDQFSIRLCGRTTVRPKRSSNSFNVSLIDVGSIVDAWLHDGWWEGIVVHKESDDRVHVYFPGEKRRSVFGCRDLRYSEEWLGNGWKQIKSRPDLLCSISSATENNLQVKSDDMKSGHAGIIHDEVLGLGEKDMMIGKHHSNIEVVRNCSKEDLLAHLNWKWSMKKRNSRNSSQNLHCGVSHKDNLEVLGTRKRDSIFMFSSLKTDNDNCKFICDSSLFHPSVVSPLTSLVMSR